MGAMRVLYTAAPWKRTLCIWRMKASTTVRYNTSTGGMDHASLGSSATATIDSLKMRTTRFTKTHQHNCFE